MTIDFPDRPATAQGVTGLPPIQTAYLAPASSASATASGGGSSAGTDGWAAIGATLTYSSTDGHTFVCATSSDLTGQVPVRSRVKVTDSGVKYFIVTAISTTTITLYGGTTYALTGGAITLPFVSLVMAPVGFPLSPASWTESFTDSSLRTQANPGNGWYNMGSLNLPVPIGAWRLGYKVQAYGFTSQDHNYNLWYKTTLSTANNSESDSSFTVERLRSSSSDGFAVGDEITAEAEGYVLVAAKTPYYLNMSTPVGDGSANTGISFYGSRVPTVIRAVCAYL